MLLFLPPGVLSTPLLVFCFPISLSDFPPLRPFQSQSDKETQGEREFRDDPCSSHPLLKTPPFFWEASWYPFQDSVPPFTEPVLKQFLKKAALFLPHTLLSPPAFLERSPPEPLPVDMSSLFTTIPINSDSSDSFRPYSVLGGDLDDERLPIRQSFHKV